MTADLVLAALNMALLTRKPHGVIHHLNEATTTLTRAGGHVLPFAPDVFLPSLASVTDPKSHATQYAYDGFDQPLTAVARGQRCF